MSQVIVLDTHVWYWWITQESGRLPGNILITIENAPKVGVASVSCFELALAHRRGRLELPIPLLEWLAYALQGSDIGVLPLTPEIAARAVQLTEIHRDPFDRIIIATALEQGAKLVSIDGHFSSYPELSDRLIDGMS